MTSRYTNNGVLVRSAIIQSGKVTLCDGDDHTKDELEEAIDQLSQYEDTDLTPKEIETIKAENTKLRAENEALRNGGYFDPLEMAKITCAVQENTRLRQELEAAKKQISDNAVFLAVHGADGYVLNTHADDPLPVTTWCGLCAENGVKSNG